MKCDTCGQRVRVHSGKEGTNSYIPAEAENLRELLAEAKQMALTFANGRKAKFDQAMREATIDGVPVQSTARKFIERLRQEGL